MGTPILLLGLCYLFHVFGVTGEAGVGCLFSPDVCEDEEFCFNDNVFGRCEEENEPPDKYRHLLEPSTLSMLESEMKRLWIGGYRWQHEYTQCVVQSVLLADRQKLHYDPGFCSRLLQMTVPSVSQEILEELEQIDPSDLALIRFSPSTSHSNPNFADEVFIPQRTVPEAEEETGEMDKRNRADDERELFLTLLDYLDEMTYDQSERFPGKQVPVIKTDLSSDMDQQQAFTESGVQWVPVEDKPENRPGNDSPDWEKDWSGYVQALPSLDGDMWQPEISVREDPQMIPFRRPMRYDTKKPGPGYYVHEPDPGTEETEAKKNPLIMKLLQQQDEEAEWKSFLKRPLDGSSSLADVLMEEENDDEVAHQGFATTTQRPQPQSTPKNQKEGAAGISVNDLEERGDKRDYFRPSQEETSALIANEDKSGHLEVIDTTHTYLLISEGTPSEDEGERLVQRLQQLLHLPRGTFSNTRVEKGQVTFKVNPNPQNLNASVVASRAEELTEELKKSSGLTIISAGIGDKIKFEVVRKDGDDHRLFVLTFVLCGCVVGVLIAVAVVYVVRRHARSRQKLQNLSQPETEASQDYQDLCRQRMQRKNNEKPEPIHMVQQPKRVSSLSQSETSQPSPSSRSSTSSWSEEPVTSNMDISTGHMILSYMEDHLKNKDRLEREWEALCAYEAEPCATIAATQPQNINKNRFPDVLPYDHSRVILNDISNVSGSDYINASTITDHDPRNPAYIATQGPLPHTAADFWQMIWEQGSVVIVMLTRLMENGFAMCHRYWPEEGSEVYHIYEVHLVSEHIWCDDYLVRSFYLKNLKTSETRTVTQFHFLSWPENGVPASTKALLEFRRKVNKSYRGRSCPIVVHCSDGSGRTGTYCLTDMVLNRMAKGAKEIDIAATLEHIRDQRSGMVKTKAQFEFVLMEIAEEVHAILKALSH